MRLFSKIVYHGSGHNFDKFDFEFMGTGQGAQVHGWGIYLTKSKNVAKSYQEQNTLKITQYKIKLDGELIEPSEKDFYKYDVDLVSAFERAGIKLNTHDALVLYKPEQWITTPIENFNDYVENYLQKTIDYYKDMSIKEPNSDYGKWADEFEDKIESLKGHTIEMISEPKGMIATVEIDDSAVFVPEMGKVKDFPRNIQIAMVRAAQKISPGLQMYSDDEVIQTFTNDSFGMNYDTFQAYYNKYKSFDERFARELSMALLENGIDGISYNGYEDGECYVMFNLDKLKIVEKE